MRWNKLRRQRKPTLLRGGVDPREAQRRSVEARKRNAQARGGASSAAHVPGEREFSPRGRPDVTPSHLLTGPHTRPGLPENKAPTTDDLLREIDAASPRPAKPPVRQRRGAERASGDIFHDFPREPNEPTNDYYLRHALHQQEKWRKIQERNGTGPDVYSLADSVASPQLALPGCLTRTDEHGAPSCAGFRFSR